MGIQLKMLNQLWSNISAFRKLQIKLTILLMVCASLAEMMSIGAILPFIGMLTSPNQIYQQRWLHPVITALNIKNASELLLPLTISFILVVLVCGMIRFALLWAQTHISHVIGADIGFEIYKRTLYQPYHVHISRNSSEVISGISSKANVVSNNTVMPVLTIINSIIMFVAVLGALLIIDIKVALISIVGFGLIYGALIFYSKKKIFQCGDVINRESNRIVQILQEGLGGIRDVIIDNSQEAFLEIYKNADSPLRKAQVKIQIISIYPRYGVEALGIVFIAGLAFSMLNESGEISIMMPVLGALLLGIQRLLPTLQQAYSSFITIRGSRALLSDTLRLLTQPMSGGHKNAVISGLQSFNSTIEIENLSFKYQDDGPWILQNINLTINKGDKVGIFGKTGSGKSTLLDILMGLLDPCVGHIKIDGVPVTETNKKKWQLHIAHVPQTIFLTDATIAENIAFGVPKNLIDYKRLIDAAAKAQLDTVIDTWKHKYDTVVGERGIRLSGGQRQRIAIARALYKRADVIVLDEATSALDTDTEQEVMNAVNKLDKELTIIIVTHRLSTLNNCNNILKLDRIS